MAALTYADDWCVKYACRKDYISFSLFIQYIFRIFTFYSGHVLARYSMTDIRNTHTSRTRQMFSMLHILANFLPLCAVIEMCLSSHICKTWDVYERGKLRILLVSSDNDNRNFPYIRTQIGLLSKCISEYYRAQNCFIILLWMREWHAVNRCSIFYLSLANWKLKLVIF